MESTAANARVGRVAGHVAPVSPPNLSPLSAEDVRTFHQKGYVVLRAALSPDEVARLSDPIMRAYAEGDYEATPAYDLPKGVKPGRYPAPGNHSIGSRILQRSPEMVPLSADHPLLLGAVEQLLEDRAVLSQYQVFMRTPGTLGTGQSSQEAVGAGMHYDYKPWRTVGSFLNFLFAVVPLVDYEDDNGPLFAASGSHRPTEILASDGRVHRMKCASVPSPEAAASACENPHLQAGDLMLMHGSCWHEAWPNRSKRDRFGLYMKYHAQSYPPAVGPIIHPSQARSTCRPHTRNTVFRHHRGDGRCASMVFRDGNPSTGRCEPSRSIDAATLIFERKDGLIFAVSDGAGGWQLPTCQVDEVAQYTEKELRTLHYLDCSQVVRPLCDFAAQEHRLGLPWVSWVADSLRIDADGEHLQRVFAYRPTGSLAEIAESNGALSIGGTWVSSTVLRQNEVAWVLMWKDQIDEDGRAVKRGFGFSQVHMNHRLSTYQTAGNDPDKEPFWVCGEYDSAGALVLPKGKSMPNVEPREVSAAQLAS